MKYLFLFFLFFSIQISYAQDLEITGTIKSNAIDATGLENPIIKLNPDGTFGAISANDYLPTPFVPYIGCPGDTLFTSSSTFLIVPGLCDANPKPLSVQARLDTGSTPYGIYQSDNTLLDSLYGKSYEGGLIFYLNTSNGEGMLCSENDILNQAIASKHWGTWSFSAGLSSLNTSLAIGSGESNTNLILNKYIAEGSSSFSDFAAKNCFDLVLNGKSDWFLPSYDEMVEIYNNLYNNSDVTSGNFDQSQYGSIYWCSSLTSSKVFWGHRFGENPPGWPGRIFQCFDYWHYPPTNLNQPVLKVRAVRNF